MSAITKISSLTRSLSALSGEQQLSIIIYVFSAAFSIFIALKFNFGIVFYISLVVGTTISIVTDRIIRLNYENKIMEHFNRASQSEHDLRAIGAPREAIKWLYKNSDDVLYVMNTMFHRKSARYFGSMDTEALNQLNKTIKFILDNGGTWNDLYLKDHQDLVDEFTNSLSERQKSKYYATSIETDVPLMQAIIIRYLNNRQSILFGWGFPGSADYKAMVFLGTSDKTVRFFEDYFESLERLATRVERTAKPTLPFAGLEPS